MLDRTDLMVTEVLLLREELVDRTIERERTEARYYRAIKRLHDYGLPLRSIAKEVRLSHQRVHQVVSNPTRTPGRHRRRVLPIRKGTPWSFSEQTTAAIEHAEHAAREHGHRSMDVQHLLLGVEAVADGPVATALSQLELDDADVLRDLADAGEPADRIPPNRPVPIAARARVALDWRAAKPTANTARTSTWSISSWGSPWSGTYSKTASCATPA